MAFFTFLLRLLLLVLTILSTSLPKSQPLLLPLTKHTNTHQYLTQIHPTIALVVDLGGPSTWVSLIHSSTRLIPCKSVECSTAMTQDHTCPSLSTCITTPRNTILGVSTKGELVHQSISHEMPDLLLSRAPALLLRGLAAGAGGMAGLGRGRIGLPAQLAGDRKFSVCVPEDSGGFLYFGDGLLSGYRVAKSMLYTPLMTSPLEPDDYFVGVKSIKINGRGVDFDGSLLSYDQNGYGGTKLSTVVAYTTLENSIYKAFTKAFVEEATTSAGGFGFNMSRVASVAPFEFCFLQSKSVPVIDLVLQSEMVKWRIHGWGSMVHVSDDVMCLGFLDGGAMSKTTSAVIVLGGRQLENNLVEFDLGGSRLGFTSLLDKQSTCSDFSSLGLGGESTSW